MILDKELEVIAESIKNGISNTFPNGKAKLGFKYTSDDNKYVSNIATEVELEVDKLNQESLTQLTDKSYLDELALRIDTALTEYKDIRGNRTDNQNFDKEAFIGRGFRCVGNDFPDRLFVWETYDNENKCGSNDNINGTVYRFRLRFNEDDDNPSPCYITEFTDTDFGTILGLAGNSFYPVTENIQQNEMNGKISTIVKDLNGRSQVNIKNIYVSPIIHRFNIVGDVYVKPLY